MSLSITLHDQYHMCGCMLLVPQPPVHLGVLYSSVSVQKNTFMIHNSLQFALSKHSDSIYYTHTHM